MAVTCEGYHAAYVKLLETAGMKTGRITGGGHVWTAVQMDGEWYHVDTTHDDVKDGLSDATAPGTLSKEQQAHLLFGLDDATMALANPSYAGSTPGYEANSLENNYFIRTGDILEWSDPIADQILQKLNQKETSFKVKATNAAWPQPTYKNPINNLVAYELNRCAWSTDNQASDAVVRVDYADDYFNVKAFAVLPDVPSVAIGLMYSGNSQTGVAVPDAGKYVVSGTPQADECRYLYGDSDACCGLCVGRDGQSGVPQLSVEHRACALVIERDSGGRCTTLLRIHRRSATSAGFREAQRAAAEGRGGLYDLLWKQRRHWPGDGNGSGDGEELCRHTNGLVRYRGSEE